jgi:hypothetical protein
MEKNCPARNDRASPLTIRNQEHLFQLRKVSFVGVVSWCKSNGPFLLLKWGFGESVFFIVESKPASYMGF